MHLLLQENETPESIGHYPKGIFEKPPSMTQCAVEDSLVIWQTP